MPTFDQFNTSMIGIPVRVKETGKLATIISINSEASASDPPTNYLMVVQLWDSNEECVIYDHDVDVLK